MPPSLAVPRRIFGLAGEGLLFCAPADAKVAADELARRNILASGPWFAHITWAGIRFGDGPIAAVAWHVNAQDRLRLDGAGLLDQSRFITVRHGTNPHEAVRK